MDYRFDRNHNPRLNLTKPEKSVLRNAYGLYQAIASVSCPEGEAAKAMIEQMKAFVEKMAPEEKEDDESAKPGAKETADV
jgi:hypothetical protein